jgi:hypothetical protein
MVGQVGDSKQRNLTLWDFRGIEVRRVDFWKPPTDQIHAPDGRFILGEDITYRPLTLAA